MIDLELNRQLTVHTEGDAGPYLMVPLQQLQAIREIFRIAGIGFSVSRDAIQIDGHDAIALIDFGRRADALRIQAVLDAH
jgi:hypothetical protein